MRVRAGGYTGWGECEASPLTSIASLVCPMSHSACRPVHGLLARPAAERPADIRRIARDVRANSLDLLQADHTLSGVEIALWDLLGTAVGTVRCTNCSATRRPRPKTPYASELFGDTPQETLHKARQARQQGYRAVKFGWGAFGRRRRVRRRRSGPRAQRRAWARTPR